MLAGSMVRGKFQRHIIAKVQAQKAVPPGIFNEFRENAVALHLSRQLRGDNTLRRDVYGAVAHEVDSIGQGGNAKIPRPEFLAEVPLVIEVQVVYVDPRPVRIIYVALERMQQEVELEREIHQSPILRLEVPEQRGAALPVGSGNVEHIIDAENIEVLPHNLGLLVRLALGVLGGLGRLVRIGDFGLCIVRLLLDFCIPIPLGFRSSRALLALLARNLSRLGLLFCAPLGRFLDLLSAMLSLFRPPLTEHALPLLELLGEPRRSLNVLNTGGHLALQNPLLEILRAFGTLGPLVIHRVEAFGLFG
mmetsp:Transcript_28349/g.56677  ORF Transcript_28349/g.56677 Transcript_28349/m.56677 type:complete len:305 (+) Transcript_28349:167-1081(+)